jgi:hypothetical protein
MLSRFSNVIDDFSFVKAREVVFKLQLTCDIRRSTRKKTRYAGGDQARVRTYV